MQWTYRIEPALPARQSISYPVKRNLYCGLKTAAGTHHDDTEAIIDCREFSGDVLREMIAEGEVRDANTLSIWARLVARGEIFL